MPMVHLKAKDRGTRSRPCLGPCQAVSESFRKCVWQGTPHHPHRPALSFSEKSAFVRVWDIKVRSTFFYKMPYVYRPPAQNIKVREVAKRGMKNAKKSS
jgi:hypothetical protein